MSEPNLNDMLSGGGLSSLLKNPEVMAKLPKIMEALGPVMAEMRAEQNSESGEEKKEEKCDENGEGGGKKEGGSAADAIAALAAHGGDKGHGKGSSSHRRALLRALEPYLSDSRREAMDYICKVLSLIDILSEVM